MWKLHEISDVDNKTELYGSEWVCTDGDCAELYIDPENRTMSLYCFSGIPASFIFIYGADLGILFHSLNIKLSDDLHENFFNIADYFCGLFCEKHKIKKKKGTGK